MRLSRKVPSGAHCDESEHYDRQIEPDEMSGRVMELECCGQRRGQHFKGVRHEILEATGQYRVVRWVGSPPRKA
jgi:hypothetical protein